MKKILIGLMVASAVILGGFGPTAQARDDFSNVADTIRQMSDTSADLGDTVYDIERNVRGFSGFFDRLFGGSSRNYNPGSGTGVGVSRPTPYNAQYDGPVFSGPGLVGGATQVEARIDTNVSRERNLKELIIGWTNFLLSIAAIMAVVALVWAGFLYITAFGEDSRMETAKKIVIWVVLGILLILASYAIVNTVMRAVF